MQRLSAHLAARTAKLSTVSNRLNELNITIVLLTSYPSITGHNLAPLATLTFSAPTLGSDSETV